MTTTTLVDLNTLPGFAHCEQVPVFLWEPSVFALPINPKLKHMDADVLRHMAEHQVAVMSGLSNDGLALVGAPGTGKNALLYAFLSATRMPVQYFQGHARATFEEMLGRTTMVDGEFLFQDGPALQAALCGHAFHLDERDTIPAHVNKALNGLMDRRPLFCPERGGTPVMVADSFMAYATQNTWGGLDVSSMAAATIQDGAVEDRWEYHAVGYMPFDVEVQVLHDHFQGLIQPSVIECAVTAANAIRACYEDKTVPLPAKVSGAPVDNKSFSVSVSLRALMRYLRKQSDYAGRQKFGPEAVRLSLHNALPLGSVDAGQREAIVQTFCHYLTAV